MTKFAWQSLKNTGLQETIYPDNERHDIRSQFSHDPKRVLDIGCSAGAVPFGLKRDYNAFAWGVELNPEAAQRASQHLDKVSTIPIEEFSNDDIELLKTVDTVLLLDVLEHMYNPWETLKFLSQHLNPNTQIIISLPNVENGELLRDLCKGRWPYQQAGLLDVTHIRFFTEYEMRKMFYETGYRIESLLHTGSYCVDQTLYEKGPFPLWVDLGNLKIHVQDHGHWVRIHTIQFFVRIRIAPDDSLTPEERALRYDPPM